MMANVMYGYRNLVLKANLSTGSQVTHLGASQLQNPYGSPSTAWQTTQGVTSVALDLVWPAPEPVQLVMVARTNLTSSATMRAEVYLKDQQQAMGEAFRATPIGRRGQGLFLFDQPVMADRVRFVTWNASNPDHFLNIPLMYVGPVFSPTYNIGWSSTTGTTLQQTSVRTQAGQQYITAQWQARTMTLVHNAVPGSELDGPFTDMLDVAALGQNIVCLPDPASPHMTDQALMGTLSLSGDITNPFGAADRKGFTLKMEERL